MHGEGPPVFVTLTGPGVKDARWNGSSRINGIAVVRTPPLRVPPYDATPYDLPVSDLPPEPAPASTPPSRAPIGSLGIAMAGVQARFQTVTVIVTTLVAIGVAAILVPALAGPVADRFGSALALLVLGLVCWAIFVIAIAVIAILPPLLLPRRERAVFAVNSWIGAREVRRTFGRASRAIGLPSDAASAEAWLARNPGSDRIRFVRVDALMLARRFDDARVEAELLPERSPLDVYRKAEARALIADQTDGTVDEDALRAGVAAVPAGIERTEAAASLAVFRARRALPDGDWRAPLLEVRPAIPGSDFRVLVADFGLPVFEILFRKAALPFAALLAIIGLSFAVVPALFR